MKINNKARRYFITDFIEDRDYYNGGIARRYVEKILENDHWEKIRYSYDKHPSFFSKIKRLVDCLSWAIRMPENATIIFFYPIYPTFSKFFIQLIAFRKNIKKIILIHDIDGIRDQDESQLKKDIHFIRKQFFYIVHNETMATWIKEINPKAKTVPISLFDYLYKGAVSEKYNGRHVAFAGNLRKSKFVQELYTIPEIIFDIYGDSEGLDAASKHPNIIFHGNIDAQIIPAKIEGSFGLVWEGHDIHDCTGKAGNYLRFNLPYKISLYLLAGLPIIIYDKAAMAPFIIKNGLGITINNLKKLPRALSAVPDDEYKKMQSNITGFQRMIRNGQNLLSALQSLEYKMS